jgi:TolB-like protein/tetratricopeptide (TPR) repeat protein
MAVGAWLFYPRASDPRPAIASLAVLPLAYLGTPGAPDDDYLADGLTGALTAELSKLGAIRVVSETSSRRFRTTAKALPDIARELGVDAIVEGNVFREGSVVRVTVQLIHGATDSHLWAETYTRSLGTVLSLQNEVALAIAAEIGATITPDERSRLTATRAVDPEAHRHYVLGHRLRQRDTEPELLRALDHFEQAIRIEPLYARAYWGIAETWLTLSSWPAYLPPREGMPKAKAAAARALEIDGSLAEALAALAFVTEVFEWNLPAAEQRYQRALRLNPNDPIAHQRYGLFLTRTRRQKDGLAHAERAYQLDPLSIDNVMDFGMRLFASGKRDEGIAMIQRARDLDTTYFHPLVHLGETYVRLDRGDDAIAAAKRAFEIQGGGFHSAHMLAHIYGQLGRFAEAAATLRPFEAPGARRNAYDIGMFYLSIKRYDEALRWLHTACEERAPQVAFWHLVQDSRQFDPVRHDRRFAALLTCATTGLQRAF